MISPICHYSIHWFCIVLLAVDYHFYCYYYFSIHENYFKWQLISRYVPFLGDAFLSNYYDFSTIISGSGKVDRYLVCISTLETLVPFSVSRLYTENILPNGTKGNVSAMVQEIKNAFEARLDENKWLDDTTRERSKWKVYCTLIVLNNLIMILILKVGNITAMIAYPDGIYNETVLDEETEIVNQANGTLFDTVLLYSAKEFCTNLKQFGKPVDKTGYG